MLLKLHDAEQNGYQLTGKYNMSSELEDMDAEYELYEKRMEQNAMIDFMQDGLMLIIKGIEMFNGMYKPLGINLSGLSDKIYDRKEQLEHILKRLAIKYSGGTEMPPELSLLFIIGGAMLMTHIGNTALSGDGMNGLLNSVMGNGGLADIMKSFTQQSPQQPKMTNSESNNQTQNIKPPNFDISSLLSKMNDISAVKPVDERDKLPFQTMSVPQPNSFPESTRIRDIDSDRFSVSSDISSDSESVTTKSINISIPSKGKRRSKKNIIEL